jgi:epoxyqueuosine reductase
MTIRAEQVKALAHQCGFELVGITPALPSQDFKIYQQWREAGMAGEMGYLTDHRGDLRSDPRNLLPEARSIICVGKLYNTIHPGSVDADRASISQYAHGADYHDIMRHYLETLVAKIAGIHPEPFESKICVDTAPLLERSYAHAAGLGWIGKNTCLINQKKGSWFFLGEILLSIPLAPDTPASSRCGTCTRCIDSCPTTAIVSKEDGWQIDARLCISYLTIEKRGEIPNDLQPKLANHIFGCDICQDVCPWNRRAAVAADSSFQRREMPELLADLAQFTAEDFRRVFRQSPVWRAKHSGFLRNVAIALGNAVDESVWEPLKHLALHPDASVASAAQQSLRRLQGAWGEEGSCKSAKVCHPAGQSRGAS